MGEQVGRNGAFGIGFLLAVGPWVAAIAPRGMAAVLAVSALVSLVSYGWARRKLPPVGGDKIAIWAAFSTLLIASSYWSPVHAHGLDFAIKAALTGAQALIVYTIARELLPQKALMGALGIGMALGLVLTLFHTLSGGMLYSAINPHLPQAEVLFSVNREVVTLSVLALPVAAVLLALAGKGTMGRSMAALVVLATYAAGFTSMSQTGPMGLTVALLVCAAAWRFPAATAWVVAVSGVVLILGLPLLLASLAHVDAVRSLDWQAAAVGQRLDIWIAVAEKSLEAPLFGHGIEASRGISDWSTGLDHVGQTYFHHPHNAVLQIWLETGLLGAGIAAALWSAIVLPFRHAARAPAVIGTLAGVFAMALVSYGLWQSWWLSVFAMLPVIFTLLRPIESENK